MDDYYEILHVSRNADPDIIKAAYNRLALKYHPDRNPGNASAEKMMKRLNDAWSVVGDPSSRSAYDRKREEAAERQPEREKEATHQPPREKETARQAEPKRGAAAEGENQTKRRDINAPRTGNNPEIRKPNWLRSVVGIALFVAIRAIGGSIAIIVAAMLLHMLR